MNLTPVAWDNINHLHFFRDLKDFGDLDITKPWSTVLLSDTDRITELEKRVIELEKRELKPFLICIPNKQEILYYG